MNRLRSHSDWKMHHDALMRSVGDGEIAPYVAARKFLGRILD